VECENGYVEKVAHRGRIPDVVSVGRAAINTIDDAIKLRLQLRLEQYLAEKGVDVEGMYKLGFLPVVKFRHDDFGTTCEPLRQRFIGEEIRFSRVEAGKRESDYIAWIKSDSVV
jgi:hypothetical protein